MSYVGVLGNGGAEGEGGEADEGDDGGEGLHVVCLSEVLVFRSSLVSCVDV